MSPKLPVISSESFTDQLDKFISYRTRVDQTKKAVNTWVLKLLWWMKCLSPKHKCRLLVALTEVPDMNLKIGDQKYINFLAMKNQQSFEIVPQILSTYNFSVPVFRYLLYIFLSFFTFLIHSVNMYWTSLVCWEKKGKSNRSPVLEKSTILTHTFKCNKKNSNFNTSVSLNWF